MPAGAQSKKEVSHMNVHLTYRRRRTALTVAAAILCSLPASSPVAGAQSSGMYFDGGGSGPTAEVAVRRAIEDAEVSASAYQLFTCEQVGEAQIFPRPNDQFGRFFGAQVRVFCTP
jgi:hypothetical protein